MFQKLRFKSVKLSRSMFYANNLYLSIFLFLSIYIIYAYMCVSFLHLVIWKPEVNISLLALLLYYIYLIQGIFLSLEITGEIGWPMSYQDTPDTLLSPEVIDTVTTSGFYISFEDVNLRLQACRASTFPIETFS